MVEVLKIQVYYRIAWGSNPEDGQVHLIERKPTSQDVDSIKLDIARIVKFEVLPAKVKPKEKIEYYYVVLKTKSAKIYKDKHGEKGRFGYRTVVPKIML